jgi:hypothetical protein
MTAIRGGGPFGAGRLAGSDADELVAALRRASGMLRDDMEEAKEGSAVEKSSSVAAAPTAPVVPVTPVAPARAAAAVKVAPVAVAVAPIVPVAVAPVTVKVSPPIVAPAVTAAVSAPSRAEEPRVLTIAEGLDAFLLDPKSIPSVDLGGLRDGIIACLGMIQTEIMSRPAATTTVAQAAPVPPPQRLAPALQEGEVNG